MRGVSRCAERQSGETSARVGQAPGHATPLAHPERPRRTQPLVAKRRTHAAKRERVISLWGREARAFTLNLLARQFRARPSVSRGLRPLMGSSQGWTGFGRPVGSRVQRGLDDPAWCVGIRVPALTTCPNLRPVFKHCKTRLRRRRSRWCAESRWIMCQRGELKCSKPRTLRPKFCEGEP